MQTESRKEVTDRQLRCMAGIWTFVLAGLDRVETFDGLEEFGREYHRCVLVRRNCSEMVDKCYISKVQSQSDGRNTGSTKWLENCKIYCSGRCNAFADQGEIRQVGRMLQDDLKISLPRFTFGTCVCLFVNSTAGICTFRSLLTRVRTALRVVTSGCFLLMICR